MSEDWFNAEKLHHAAQDGDLAKVQQLLDGGFDANAFDSIGNTPLHYAAQGEHFELVNLLLSQGANVNANDKARAGDTPLGHIAQTCSLKMAQLLINAGGDPRIPGCMQINAIHRAKQRKRGEGPAVYRLFCKHVGLDPNQ